MLVEKYFTIEKSGSSIIKEKGSKFLGQTFLCDSEEKAKTTIDSLRKEHPNAVHVCFAWKFGVHSFKERYSDDGEPNNSAGKPIFGQIINANITNTLITVVRYYGGVNLGVGGLISAYKNAAVEAIANSIIVEKELSYDYLLRYSFKYTGNANIILSKNNANVYENGYDNQGPFIKFSANKEKVLAIQAQIAEFPDLNLIEIT